MSVLTIDTAEPRRSSSVRRFLSRVVNWLKEEYRLTCHARIQAKAANGDAKAQYILGTLCEAPHGTGSVAETLKWYKKAAFQGLPEAQLALGLKYLHGQGVTQSDDEALLWFRKAAEQGQPEAQFHLGNLYSEGRGAARDLVQADKWRRKAEACGRGGTRNRPILNKTS